MIALTSDSAMRLLATDGLLDNLEPVSQTSIRSWQKAPISDINELEAYGIVASKARPLHILVRSKSDRVQSERVVNHVWSGTIPPGSLHYLASGVMISSPEFCFLQAAGDGIGPAACIAMESCGSYGRDGSARGFCERDPISSVEKLRRYLDAADGSRGVKNAREALRLTVEGSRSPLETKAAVLLTAPVAIGGYGLPTPKSNWPVIPAADDSAFFYDSHYVIDLCWPRKKVALECDSYAYHSSKDERDHDASKRNALTIIGWTCFSVTSGQLSGSALDILARQLARALGVGFRQPDARLRDDLIASLA